MHKTAAAALAPDDEVAEESIQASPINWWRRSAQVGSLAIIGQWSFYGIFRCPFIVPYVSCQNCPVITCHGRILSMFWGFWLLIPISALVFGRAFCAWICPGGLVNQLLGSIAPFKLRIRNALMRIIPNFKYIGLALALYIWLYRGQPRKAVPIRIGDFFSSVALTFEHATPLWLYRTFFVLGFAALSIFVANAWCRFACPAGGLLEILRSTNFLKVYKNEKCDSCDKCLKVCEMGARPSEANCTNCCDCLSVCPQDAIQIGLSRRSK